MQIDSAVPGRIALQGEWTMNGAAQRLELLAEQFTLLLAEEPRAARAEIDLSGMTGLDACGCQLLAVFLEQLKGHGILPEATGLPPLILEEIQLLGFAEAFAVSGAPGQESA